jgi:glycine dehydrogenase subunit 2
LQENLKDDYWLKYDRPCMHEFVLSACRQKDERGVRAVDIAKQLLDMGFHPPTVYFPLIVPEALMIEPTETESVDTLDAFIDAMKEIALIARENPGLLHGAPRKMPVGRLDDVRAARQIDVKWKPPTLE